MTSRNYGGFASQAHEQAKEQKEGTKSHGKPSDQTVKGLSKLRSIKTKGTETRVSENGSPICQTIPSTFRYEKTDYTINRNKVQKDANNYLTEYLTFNDYI